MKACVSLYQSFSKTFLVMTWVLVLGTWCQAKEESSFEERPIFEKRASGLDKNITKVVAKLIQDYHYSGLKLNDEVSELFFEEYFLRLDPNRYFFLQSDIDAFVSKKTILDDLIVIGNVDFAFEVYERLLQRIKETGSVC